MAHIEIKAQQLREEAEKKLNGSFFRTLFGSTSQRIDESIEYYIRAGNLFKMAKNWSQAGGAFVDAAELSLRNSNHTEAAVNYVEAGNCYKKISSTEAVSYYSKAIDIYQDRGRFLMAAKYHQIIAEILECEYDIDEAVLHYEKAADFFKQECSYSAANKCLEKIAEYAAIMGDYDKAITIFQEIACFDLASTLLKYSAKQYFFQAAICLLCTENDIRTKVQAYVRLYPAFEDSRELQLIICLMEYMAEGHEEKFNSAVKQFDYLSPLTQWQLTMLQRAKNQIIAIPDLK